MKSTKTNKTKKSVRFEDELVENSFEDFDNNQMENPEIVEVKDNHNNIEI